MKTLIPISIACSVLLMTSCSSTKVITGPDGTPHQLITCVEVEDCYAQATSLCQGKYKIVNTSSEMGGTVGDATSTTRLLVKCGGEN